MVHVVATLSHFILTKIAHGLKTKENLRRPLAVIALELGDGYNLRNLDNPSSLHVGWKR
jgi:hypothetical protein